MKREGNKPFQRTMNRSLVLYALRETPGLSRRDLAEALALDRSTISNIVGELIELGLLEEIETGPNSEVGTGARGRPAVGLRVRDERLCVLGLEISAERYRAVVRDNAGTIRYRTTGSRQFRSEPGDAVATLVAELSERAEAHAGVRVVGAGCAVPGSVHSAKAHIVYSRELDVTDCDLPRSSHVGGARSGEAGGDRSGETGGERSGEAGGRVPGGAGYAASGPGGQGPREADGQIVDSNRGLRAGAGRSIPIVYDNDANCGAWGEVHHGTGDGRNLLFVQGMPGIRHFGIGIGVVVDGVVRSGANHGAGEFCSTAWNGDERSQLSLDAERASAAGTDAEVRSRLIDEMLRNLVPVVSVLDPSAVVFGGFFREHFNELHSHCVGENAAGMERIAPLFRSSAAGVDEIAAGAAGMFHQQLFRVPRYDSGESATTVRWNEVAALLEEAG